MLFFVAMISMVEKCTLYDLVSEHVSPVEKLIVKKKKP